mmetsp:Transcript_28356/g.65301  ORF Transcript_28356/g.65301 Transcript_28356/m.65301 type:complete len:406 (-) Transcript_28356:173-1390(-)
MTQEPGTLLLIAGLAAVLELGEEVNECVAHRGHHVRRVAVRQPPDGRNGSFANVEVFVVETNEQRANALGLREEVVEARVERGEHGVPNVRVRVRDRNAQQLLQNLSNQRSLLSSRWGRVARQNKELGASQCCFPTDSWSCVVEISVNAVAHELDDDAALEVEGPKSRQGQCHSVGVHLGRVGSRPATCAATRLPCRACSRCPRCQHLRFFLENEGNVVEQQSLDFWQQGRQVLPQMRQGVNERGGEADREHRLQQVVNVRRHTRTKCAREHGQTHERLRAEGFARLGRDPVSDEADDGVQVRPNALPDAHCEFAQGDKGRRSLTATFAQEVQEMVDARHQVRLTERLVVEPSKHGNEGQHCTTDKAVTMVAVLERSVADLFKTLVHEVASVSQKFANSQQRAVN